MLDLDPQSVARYDIRAGIQLQHFDMYGGWLTITATGLKDSTMGGVDVA